MLSCKGLQGAFPGAGTPEGAIRGAKLRPVAWLTVKLAAAGQFGHPCVSSKLDFICGPTPQDLYSANRTPCRHNQASPAPELRPPPALHAACSPVLTRQPSDLFEVQSDQSKNTDWRPPPIPCSTGSCLPGTLFPPFDTLVQEGGRPCMRTILSIVEASLTILRSWFSHTSDVRAHQITAVRSCLSRQILIFG